MCLLVVFSFIKLRVGLVGTAITLDFSWWVTALGLLTYTICGGGCPLSWTGFSTQAFSGLWQFLRLSLALGVMLWYYCPAFLCFLFH
uniref:Uncharacterized protein n=1 Tax=Nelumbo nucifera TaxID=4432 RepID=A0A822Z3P8_NELNU|nr:TPA_asm: hypothetical protein HUJ06_015327 [Nelumbo nucifera]